MSKKRRRGCRRVYRSKSRESRCQHERGRKECRWEVQAAHRCQPALCLRANGGVTLTRQGRGVQTSSCTTGAAVTLSAPSVPRLPSLFMPCIAGRTCGDGHDWGDGRSDLAWFKSWYFFFFPTGGCENAKVSWGLGKIKQTKSPGRFKCSFNCVLWWPDSGRNCYCHTFIMHETQTAICNCCDYTTGDTNYKLDCYSLKTRQTQLYCPPFSHLEESAACPV